MCTRDCGTSRVDRQMAEGGPHRQALDMTLAPGEAAVALRRNHA